VGLYVYDSHGEINTVMLWKWREKEGGRP